MWVGAAVTVSLVLLDPVSQHSSEPYFSPHLLSVRVLGLLSQASVVFGCLPTSSGAVQFDSRIEEWESRTTTSGSNTRVSIHYSQSRLERGRGGRTQFIPGALPPKLKLLGTTGTVNLYPPCFSIIFDSKSDWKRTAWIKRSQFSSFTIM